MSYSPILPAGGFRGLAYLDRTYETQRAAHSGTPSAKADEAYFREKIGGVTSAAQLVGDRRLLSVALAAYGLSGDLNNRAFIRKVLEDGTLDPRSLANRLADKRYAEFSRAFGFGDYSVPRTQVSDFADKLIARWKDARFETAVGEADDNLRLALNARRELAALSNRPISNDAGWYSILGSPPLRKVVEVAFGLPAAFSQIDIDQQLAAVKARARTVLSTDTVRDFSLPDIRDRLVQAFVLRAEVSASAAARDGQSTALKLLTGRAASVTAGATRR